MMPTHANLSDGIHVVSKIDHHPTGDRHTHRVFLACGIAIDAMAENFAAHADDGARDKPTAKHDAALAHSRKLAAKINDTEPAHLAARGEHEQALEVLEDVAQIPKLRKLHGEAMDAWEAEARGEANTTKLVVLALACGMFSEHIQKVMADPTAAAAEAAQQQIVTTKRIAHDKAHAEHLDAYQAHARANEELAKHRAPPKIWITATTAIKATCAACAKAVA